MSTTTDRAYLAGLLDGEGYIGIQRGRMWNRARTKWRWRYKLVVVITMCAKPTILWVHQHFGGKVYARGTGSVQCLSAKARQQWTWIIADAAAERVLRHAFPYLQHKAVEAECAFRFRALVPALGQKSSSTVLRAQQELKITLQTLKKKEYCA